MTPPGVRVHGTDRNKALSILVVAWLGGVVFPLTGTVHNVHVASDGGAYEFAHAFEGETSLVHVRHRRTVWFAA